MAPLFNESHKYKYVKMTCMILALIAVLLIIVWARAFYGSMQAYQKGETYLEERRYVKAVTFFDRSIHWYTPFNPYVRKSAERLWEIGLIAERKGDIKLALIAFRTIRRGFYAASNFITPGKNWIEKSESKIDALVAIEEEKKGGGEDFDAEKKLIIQNQKTTPPSIFWSIILEIGFLGWVGSVIGLIMLMVKPKEGSKYLFSGRVILIGLTLFFFAFWIVGMMKA